MRALTFNNYGDVDELTLGAVPEPHAGEGQVRIKVKAASVNGIDRSTLAGMLSGGKPLEGKGQLGYDAAGVVDEVGDGVTGVSVGDDVFGLGRHTQAEFAVLNAWAAKPASIDWSVAAAAGVSVETSERSLRLLDVKRDDVLFVDGGAGGVGAVATQMAIVRGATVIASASEANQGYLREIRAIPVTYGDGMIDRIRALGHDHFDAVLDVAGKTAIEDLIALVEKPSQVLSIANFDALKAGARVSGGAAGESRPFDALNEGAELLKENKLVIKVQTFPLDRAVEAYTIAKGGHMRGKLVLLP